MAQWIKGLPFRPEDLSLDTQSPRKSQAWAHRPVATELEARETEGSLGLDMDQTSRKTASSNSLRNFASGSETENTRARHVPSSSGPMHTHLHTHIRTHVHTRTHMYNTYTTHMHMHTKGRKNLRKTSPNMDLQSLYTSAHVCMHAHMYTFTHITHITHTHKWN